MNYREELRERQLRLIVQGDLKTSDAKLFEQKLLMGLEKNHHVLVDMEAVGFICSSALRGLLAAQQKADEMGDGELVLTHVGEEVMNVFRSTGFQHILTIRES